MCDARPSDRRHERGARGGAQPPARRERATRGGARPPARKGAARGRAWWPRAAMRKRRGADPDRSCTGSCSTQRPRLAFLAVDAVSRCLAQDHLALGLCLASVPRQEVADGQGGGRKDQEAYEEGQVLSGDSPTTRASASCSSAGGRRSKRRPPHRECTARTVYNICDFPFSNALINRG